MIELWKIPKPTPKKPKKMFCLTCDHDWEAPPNWKCPSCGSNDVTSHDDK